MVMKSFCLLLGLVLMLANFAMAQSVIAVEVKDVITVGTLETFKAAMERAERENAEALLVILDTPGGGLSETLEIIKLIDRAKIPVISFVYPEGATAWSAGTMILVSSDVAAMGPNTVIGSAQPVKADATGSTPINDSKIINALTALISEKARVHKRNQTAAVEFITENLNLNSKEAKKIGVIEFEAHSENELLQKVDGMKLKGRLLNTRNARVERFEPSVRLQFLSIISNPLIASLFLLIGIYALIFGLSSPGVGSEIAGLVLLAVGLVGLGFNINLTAIFLVLLGAGLVLYEIYSPGFGIIGGAGVIALIVGSILLIPTDFPRYFISDEARQSMVLMVVVPTIVLAAFLVFAVYKIVEVRKRKPVIGGLEGDEGEVIEEITPNKAGFVMVNGEYWQAKADKKIAVGERVIVEKRKDTFLIVRKIK